jgi:hypothetical protein
MRDPNNSNDVAINIQDTAAGGANANNKLSYLQSVRQYLTDATVKSTKYLKEAPVISTAIRVADGSMAAMNLSYAVALLSIAADAAYEDPIIYASYASLVTAVSLADKYYFKDEVFSKTKTALIALSFILRSTVGDFPNKLINDLIIKNTLLAPNFGPDLNRLFSALRLTSLYNSGLSVDSALDATNFCTGYATNMDPEKSYVLMAACGIISTLGIPTVSDNAYDLVKKYFNGIGENVFNTIQYGTYGASKIHKIVVDYRGTRVNNTSQQQNSSSGNSIV